MQDKRKGIISSKNDVQEAVKAISRKHITAALICIIAYLKPYFNRKTMWNQHSFDTFHASSSHSG